jgi:hypothetical protein
MRITSLAVALSCSCALLPGTAVSEDTGVGPPLALAPGEASPLTKQGPLAEPRSSDQVGFPKIVTEYVISPATLTPAIVALGLGRVKTKSDLVVMPSGRQIFAFFCSPHDRRAQNSGCGYTA